MQTSRQSRRLDHRLCGLIPSAVVIAWILLTRLGFEESAGGMGFALILAVPSCVGGANRKILNEFGEDAVQVGRSGGHEISFACLFRGDDCRDHR